MIGRRTDRHSFAFVVEVENAEQFVNLRSPHHFDRYRVRSSTLKESEQPNLNNDNSNCKSSCNLEARFIQFHSFQQIHAPCVMMTMNTTISTEP